MSVCPECGMSYPRVSERPTSEQDRSLGDTVDRTGGRGVMGGTPTPMVAEEYAQGRIVVRPAPRHPNVRYVGDVLPSGRRVVSVSPIYYVCA